MNRQGGHRPGWARRLTGDQRGQTTIFVALAAMVLICFLAFMVNLGQLVHDRILAQSVADMAALSAANVQAAGLNEIADINMEYKALERDLKRWLVAGTWVNAGTAQNLVSFFTNFMSICNTMAQGASTIYAGMAHVVAYRVLEWHNREHGGSRPFRMAPLVGPVYPGMRLTALEHRGQEFQAYTHIVPMICCQMPAISFIPFRLMPITPSSAVGIPAGGVAVWDSYLTRDSETVTYYRVLVWREPVKVFANLPDLGFDVKLPTIMAASLAMPTGGNIENCKPDYIARFAPVDSRFKYDIPFYPYKGKYSH
jgi:hypothetical protein